MNRIGSNTKSIEYRLRRTILLLLLINLGVPASSQEIFFHKVLPPTGKALVHVTGMVQDKNGYLWLATKNGLFRHDGYQMIHYKNNPLNPKSISSVELEAIAVDSSGNIWIGTFNAGLEKFDPNTGVFTHYRHNPNDKSSLGADTIVALLCDRDGNIWVGNNAGLDKLDTRTGKFTAYRHNPNDVFSISSNEVRAIYEDKKGELWIGTGSVYSNPENNDPEVGGLNRFDKKNWKVYALQT